MKHVSKLTLVAWDQSNLLLKLQLNLKFNISGVSAGQPLAAIVGLRSFVSLSGYRVVQVS